jgi:hypothetical protein
VNDQKKSYSGKEWAPESVRNTCIQNRGGSEIEFVRKIPRGSV